MFAFAWRGPHHTGMKIVNFIAEDMDETGVPYAGVIPVEKVIDPFGDAILAYEMNGETLPRLVFFCLLPAPASTGDGGILATLSQFDREMQGWQKRVFL